MAGTLLGGMLTAMAQSVAVFHLNNGASDNYGTDIVNGYKMYVWQYQPDTQRDTYTYGDNQTAPFDVAYANRQNNNYGMTIVWKENIPVGFSTNVRLCLSTSPGVSLENCEWQTANLRNKASFANGDALYLAFVGKPYLDNNSSLQLPSYETLLYIDSYDRQRGIDIILEHGKTYYYRTFAKAYYNHNGEPDSTLFYGIEKSFRVPNLMSESGLLPSELYGVADIYPSAEAWAAFNQRFSSEPNALAMGHLWVKWMATDEGKQWLSGADKQQQQFDDGSLTLVSSIPDSFYQWITSREIIINSIDQIAELSYNVSAQGDTLYDCQPVMVAQVDSKWQLPGNSYMRFDPLNTSVNPSVSFDVLESLIPDMKYKAVVTFAPETRTELADSIPTLFAPTKIRVTVTDAIDWSTRLGESDYEIPAGEKTVLEFDSVAPSRTLKVETRVANSALRNGAYNRIMRISEIRLVPVKE